MLSLLDHVDPSDISKDALMHSIKPLVGLVFVVIEALMHCIGCWSSFVISLSASCVCLALWCIPLPVGMIEQNLENSSALWRHSWAAVLWGWCYEAWRGPWWCTVQRKGVYNEDQVSWIKLKFHGIHWLPIFVNSSSYRCMRAAKREGADSGRL